MLTEMQRPQDERNPLCDPYGRARPLTKAMQGMRHVVLSIKVREAQQRLLPAEMCAQVLQQGVCETAP